MIEFITSVAFIESVIKIGVVFGVVMTVVAYLSWAERRVSALMQDRRGPNRVGPMGLLQPLADGIKFLFKEDFIPGKANKLVFIIAPAISLTVALITFAVIPFGYVLELFGHEVKLLIADLNVGILYIFAIGSLGVYGIVLGGWSSNNKYSLLGGLRSSAQMISYEISLGLSVIGIIMIAGSLRLGDIVNAQTGWQGLKWGVVMQPLGFLLFLVSSVAETNRAPFDLPEAESELVAGYHTEYSSMKFAMFFMAEYANVTVACALMVLLFTGGWYIPFISAGNAPFGIPDFVVRLLEVGWFSIKVAAFLFFFLWLRWTLPRFRYDQLMKLGWQVLLPLSLINILITAIWLMVF